jgi:hypothetical protein
LSELSTGELRNSPTQSALPVTEVSLHEYSKPEKMLSLDEDVSLRSSLPRCNSPPDGKRDQIQDH